MEKKGGDRALVTVLGEDRPGIVAKVATALYECGANIEDISQTVMQDLFTMIMLVSLDESKADFAAVKDRVAQTAAELGMRIELQHEDVFRFMHRV
jgi:ACT domain-containing protein